MKLILVVFYSFAFALHIYSVTVNVSLLFK